MVRKRKDRPSPHYVLIDRDRKHKQSGKSDNEEGLILKPAGLAAEQPDARGDCQDDYGGKRVPHINEYHGWSEGKNFAFARHRRSVVKRLYCGAARRLLSPAVSLALRTRGGTRRKVRIAYNLRAATIAEAAPRDKRLTTLVAEA
jgi:hypothetical protein